MNTRDIIGGLVAIVGTSHVATEGDLTAHERDWRGRITGKALAVVRPATTAQVANVVRLCTSAGVSIVPQGGNTGLVGGSVPDQTGKQIVLHTGRMTAVRQIDPDNMTVTVEAGCILQNLQSFTRAEGFLFPLSLGAQGSCTIGGNLATNAGGTQVLRYGNMRELCLGLEVVTAGGEIWNGLSGLRKDNTGYALRDLFVGSEGTLGIITAATLKLFPLPRAVVTAWVSLASVEDAIALLALAQQRLSAGLTGFELMERLGLELAVKHLPQTKIPFLDEGARCNVLLEYSSTCSQEDGRSAMESLLEEAFNLSLATNAVIAESLAQAQQLWQVREHIVLAQAQDGPNVKHDVSVPISKIPAFISQTRALLERALPGVRIANFGHLGDGNLHYNVLVPDGDDATAFLRRHEAQIMNIVYKSVSCFGGSFSAEHGVGGLKVHKLEQYKCPVALSMMRLIKDALDPSQTLNPGRVLARKSSMENHV